MSRTRAPPRGGHHSAANVAAGPACRSSHERPSGADSDVGARYVRTSTQSTVTPRRGVAQWRRPGQRTRQPSGPPTPPLPSLGLAASVGRRLRARNSLVSALDGVSIRHDDAWLTMPLLGANLLTAGSMLLAIFNNWSRRAPRPTTSASTRGRRGGPHPDLRRAAVHGRPHDRIVLDQNWPQDRLVIIVGDDAHSDEMAEAVYDVAERFPASSIIYHEPRGAVTHAGEATPRRGTSILAMSCSSRLRRRLG